MATLTSRLPSPPPEPPADRSLDHLAPKFRAAVEPMLADLNRMGYPARIAEATRTDERQAWLHGFGREYDDGRGIVTNAATGDTSWHKYGLAVDIVSVEHGWDAPMMFWHAVGDAARNNGLVWGGDWPRFKDRPHVQWGEPMRQSPSRRAAELYAAGGAEAVWKEVGAV